ncbi:hypothetical protein NAEGRDRAFT_82136 [Naegleria gruberi]|uniref:Transmembrane protein n=1 Tax=Naegleria gruberi TaxID=5762 RepID=D2W2G3_NAEGR|nr:uncharacterized protein NAEGRDRAFT_82136 [Naegleria gruberi]EFC36743.1 hypothetical protein NAEGRDRAFT_82136 [Naegleria gruberi]|eukprot:XP_002669487.1 hypothetical protein NAEGRDRAFT_82136 [Naegleria gruberi strain NEG-M]
MLNKSILVILLISLILCVSTTSVTAQTCKNAIVAFDPSPCSSCTTCTGVTKSCCSVIQDTAASIVVSALTLLKASESCVMYMKMYSCAVCDVNNAKYASSSGSITVCRSYCQKVKDACGTSSTNFKDCSSYPETNCWNSAPLSGKVNWVLFALAAIVATFMF